MKKFVCLILVLLSCIMLFSSCYKKDDTIGIKPSGIRIYFIRKDDDGRLVFDFENKEIESESTADRIEEILSAVKKPTSKGAYFTVPEYINIQSVEQNGTEVVIDFSESYKYLDTKQRVLATVVICRSLVSDEGISYVAITCQGEPQAPLYERYFNRNSFVLEDRAYMR